MGLRIPLPQHAITDFCRRWKITEFAFFGSVLREDFNVNSDIDVLVTFATDARWTMLDLTRMAEELERLFGRKVDLLTKRGVEQSRNANRKAEILRSAEVIYAAA